MRTVFILGGKHFDINQNLNICSVFFEISERRWHAVVLVEIRPGVGFNLSENLLPTNRHAVSLLTVRGGEAAALVGVGPCFH